MIYKHLKKPIITFFIFSVLSVGYASAETNTYIDNFDSLETSNWTTITPIPITPYTWQIINGTVYGTGGKSGLIFEKFTGKQYVSEIDFTASDTQVQNYTQVGFYFYYKNLDNYGRFLIQSDNRGGYDHSDVINIEFKGLTSINTQTYINTSSNTSIEFKPNLMHNLKVLRLSKNIYVYYDNRLALTTTFKDDNPEGKVGFDVYASTGYFDNFSLRPISLNNASGYLDKLNLTSTNPTTRLGHYTLRFEGIQSGGDAKFSLNKYGKKVDTALAQAGSTVSLNFENWDKGVEFKLADAVDDGKDGIVQLEDIISASSESTSVGIDKISLLPEYHQNENMNISFLIANPGTIGFNGTSSVTIESGGRRSMLNPDLDLGAGKSQNFETVLKSPETPGVHTLTINLELDDGTEVTKSMEYNVTMLNPLLTILSSDLREGGGIYGSVTFNSAYPDKLVKWDTNITVEIFRIVENGREGVYFNNISVTKSGNAGINIPYSDFYHNDGRYLVSLTLGNMKSERLFEIKGQDGIYNPTDKSEIILVIDNLYSQIIMLLLGMIAALSIRNYRNQTSNISLDVVVSICGFIIFIAGIVHGWINVTLTGIFMAGLGLMLYSSQKNDLRVHKLISLKTPIHDFAILAIIFLSMSYLILLIPEWNAVLTMGTLIGYYIILNIIKEPGSGNGNVVIPVKQARPERSENKDVSGAGEKPNVLKKLIFAALAILILVGIVWTFYPGANEQPLNIQPGVETSPVAGIPSVTEIPVGVETPVFAETIVPEITPTGNRAFIILDRYRILRGISSSIKVGDEVIWINEGQDSITVVSDNMLEFSEKFLDVGKRTTPYLVTSPGTYSYYLKGNKNVNGTIKVT